MAGQGGYTILLEQKEYRRLSRLAEAYHHWVTDTNKSTDAELEKAYDDWLNPKTTEFRFCHGCNKVLKANQTFWCVECQRQRAKLGLEGGLDEWALYGS